MSEKDNNMPEREENNEPGFYIPQRYGGAEFHRVSEDKPEVVNDPEHEDEAEPVEQPEDFQEPEPPEPPEPPQDNKEEEPAQMSEFQTLQDDIIRLSRYEEHGGQERNQMKQEYEAKVEERRRMYEQARRDGFLRDAESIVDRAFDTVVIGGNWDRFYQELDFWKEDLEKNSSDKVIRDNNGNEKYTYANKYGGIYRAAIEGVQEDVRLRRLLKDPNVNPDRIRRRSIEAGAKRVMPIDFLQDELDEVFQRERDEKQTRDRAAQPALVPPPVYITPPVRDEAAEVLRGDPNKELHDRINDMYLVKHFFRKYPPEVEPKALYRTEIITGEERRLYENIWELGRAKVMKDKDEPEYFGKTWERDNPDGYTPFDELTTVELGELYHLIPENELNLSLDNDSPVRRMMEFYARRIVHGDTLVNQLGNPLKFDSGYDMTIWNCRSIQDFEKFRQTAREQRIARFNLTPDQQKLVDATAWDMISILGLPESADSRYSYSGMNHYWLPTIIAGRSFKGALHSQEAAEGRWSIGRKVGQWDNWGVEHLTLEKAKHKVGKQDEVKFVAGDVGNYFRMSLTNERPIDIDKRARGGKVFALTVPECYPTTNYQSMLEIDKVRVMVNGKEKEMSLLECLVYEDRVNGIDGIDIPWEQLLTGELGTYAGRIRSSAQLEGMFTDPKKENNQKLTDSRKYQELEWASEAAGLFNQAGTFKNLKPSGLLKRLRGDQIEIYTDQEELVLWLIGSAFGGQKPDQIRSKKPEFRIPNFRRKILEKELSKKHIGLLPQHGLLLRSGRIKIK